MRTICVVLVALALSATAFADEPKDAGAWFRDGIAKHDAGDYKGALESYAKAESMGFAQPFQLWQREARASAKTGQADKAFELLGKLVAGGFGMPELIDAENDYLPIRTDARYAQTVASMKKNAHPCAAPEYRQFDYWLGEWDVEANGAKVATSSIQLALDECVIFENYQTLRSYAGKSFSLYDSNTKKWQQRYVDTTGALHEYIGALEGDTMRFYWRYTANGKPVVQRMSYLREGPDKVRQLMEISTDGEKTWATNFDGLYVRRK